MVATLVYIQVKPEFLAAFIEATKENHKNSVKERGNLRFDILQDIQDSTRFVFYEAYESDAYAAAHKETKHYQKWRDTVVNWMAKPREGVKHAILFPTSE